MHKQRPNLIVLIADDHRSSSIGVHGCLDVSTPALDAMAAQGTDFTEAHCQGGFNPAVCVPSRASLLTGRSVFELTPRSERQPADIGAASSSPGSHLSEAVGTLPESLRSAGYRTHAIGKWHNDKASFTRGFSSAEHILFAGMSEHDQMMLQDFDAQGHYGEKRERHVPGHSTDLFRDAALRFLEQANDDESFFLYVAFTAPHDPRTPPKQHLVDPAAVTLPEAWAPMHPFDNGEALVRDERLAPMPRSPADVRQHLADYYGMLGHLDDAIGAIVEKVNERGLADNTVVVYTADHGIGLGNHGLMGKQNLYEHSLGVPLIIGGAGLPAGQTNNALVWHADTHATLRSLAGLPPDARCAGHDLLPLIQTEDTGRNSRRYFGAAYRSSQRMIRDERYKLIRYFPNASLDAEEGGPDSFDPAAVAPQDGATPGSRLDQLFDLELDPSEQVNLIFSPDHAATRTRLSAALFDWQRQEDDHLLADVPA